MLDRLYQRFDELSLHFRVFKVETIGGACVVCGCVMSALLPSGGTSA